MVSEKPDLGEKVRRRIAEVGACAPGSIAEMLRFQFVSCDLRRLARLLREHLHLDDVLYFPIVELLDVMTELFDDFNYEVVEDKVLSKKVHADTDIRTGHIRIKESVYEGACNGEGRDRMTIAHEIGHYFTLCFCGFRLERNFSGGKIPAFRALLPP